MSTFITLKVNGKSYEIDVPPDMPLLYALRNNLMLNGPKYGCGIERCGSCMVLLDGKAEPSCMKPCSDLEGVDITTIEALGSRDNLSPLQEAFVDMQAAQCGYCINGMIISAKSLLDQNPNPTLPEIKEGLQRVLCRCGSQSRIIDAVLLAAKKLKT
ncbi:(2Fe-2S)-binding protein [Anditalea andensis]|uniref:(2Fe-2S)-binding protein n=1 Tax=Anditalea andensis TaxID=1048983 RepID=A0A074L2W6_9BACT|nr:(2Fe-2S)-binding protein [Anditalea andensis]KEO74840.1 (2Fe-2S)-binding protein [Anditalea andensis]